MSSPQSAAQGTSSVAIEKAKGAPWHVFFLLSLIWSGLVVTEQVSNHVLPLTLKHFTDNAGIIGLVLALNPAFGFIAQPLAGIVSDRIWTPLGRRAILLVTGAPIVAVCLWYVPETRVFWHVVVLVVIYQFFQDVLWGSDNPLIADLVPPRQRTLVMGCMISAAQGIAFLFLRFGMGGLMEKYGERSLYQIAAAAQVILVGGAALLIREKKDRPKIERAKLTVQRYFADMFGDPILRRFGALAFVQTFFFTICTGFMVLFATQSVGLTRGQFGDAWSWQAFCMLCLAVPAGMVVEHFHKGRALVGAYVFCIGACVLGYLTHGYATFVALSVAFGLCQVVINVTQKAFFTEYLPADIIGQLSGAYNICLALGRSLALAAGGWFVLWAGNDYRVVWLVGGVAAVLAVWLATSLPDQRYEQRTTEKAASL